ncbi:MAG: TetR/AcrR family transcriptional regulator [Ruminococcus sp.]
MANEGTRQRILEVSVELFSKKGYDAVGVQEIADECHLTKPALYYHFNSKAGILEGIMEQFIEPLVEKLKISANYEGDFEKNLQNFAYCYVSVGCNNLPLYTMMMSMQYAPPMSEFNNAFMKHCVKINEIAISIFTNARDTLGNMNGREKQFAMTFLGILSFHVYSYRFVENPKMNKNEVNLLIHQFLHGIYS